MTIKRQYNTNKKTRNVLATRNSHTRLLINILMHRSDLGLNWNHI